MRIPPHIVDQVRSASDIVSIVGASVQLRRRGRNYVGLCPFHQEKTPSFNVLEDKGIFKCFGCGKGGDAITFLMEQNKVSFIEAVQDLARRAGITIELEDDEEHAAKDMRLTVGEALREASDYYQSQLRQPEGEVARSYLASRGFSDAIMSEFGLGYSPDGWTNVVEMLGEIGFEPEDIVAAGLAKERERGEGIYDTFRGRLMFPIHSNTGKVIAFGARRLTEDKTQPKYINSPQTILYDKSRVLYGLYQAKEHIRTAECALLAEGYADVMALHQAGFRNAVASSGTALTKEQLRLLRRYAQKLIVMYDGDTAGVNAALRGIDIAVEEGFDVNVLRLPSGDDPDSYIRDNGKEAFAELMAKALPLIDFKIAALLPQGGTPSATEQAAVIRSIVETIGKVPDPLKRELLLRDLAVRFSLDEHLLKVELQSFLAKQKSTESAKPARFASTAPAQYHPPQEPTQLASPQYAQPQLRKEEKIILATALFMADAYSFLTLKIGLKAEEFITPQAQEIFSLIHAHIRPAMLPARTLLALDDLPDDLRDLIIDLGNAEAKPSEQWKRFDVEIENNIVKAVADCVFSMRLHKAQKEIDSLKEKMKNGDEHNEMSLLKEFQEKNMLVRRLRSYIGGAEHI